ncbi:MAG: bifunctional nuclease family protein [Flavobacteriaceae bacterium]|nr:bifunctional nuclease family protein [Flavobacteriaceae bacterium]MBT4416157.1 bifunctional nuclease family protein [Flavobacteriaceae bacterium]MBT5012361.1 bifunctional nuclease family protein [Flavobacteriaceae bacterium]MBT7010324.1 bifunctional nuclease family protein [Flavobacteriaceae bacterium]MBT7554676.1 bifunctional nuclease family protein [Flavobacteriaceae bacterium]
MSLIRLTINRISYSQTHNGAYALLLNEKDGERKLPVVIGGFEAQSIAVALEKEIKPPRPLTHDLFKNFSDCFEIKIKQVIIHKIVDGVFFSSLICVRDKIEEIIDSRTSDAIALAIRFNSPIFTFENVLAKAGIIIKPSDSKKNKKGTTKQDPTIKKIDYSKLSVGQLEKAIEIAVKNEDYELAAYLRDEINRKK